MKKPLLFFFSVLLLFLTMTNALAITNVTTLPKSHLTQIQNNIKLTSIEDMKGSNPKAYIQFNSIQQTNYTKATQYDFKGNITATSEFKHEMDGLGVIKQMAGSYIRIELDSSNMSKFHINLFVHYEKYYLGKTILITNECIKMIIIVDINNIVANSTILSKITLENMVKENVKINSLKGSVRTFSGSVNWTQKFTGLTQERKNNTEPLERVKNGPTIPGYSLPIVMGGMIAGCIIISLKVRKSRN
jgi:hypothetical protein